MYEGQTGYFTEYCIESLGGPQGRPNSEKVTHSNNLKITPLLGAHFPVAASHNCIEDSSSNVMEASLRCQEKALLPGEKK